VALFTIFNTSHFIQRYKRLIAIGGASLFLAGAISVHYLLLPSYTKVITQVKTVSYESVTNLDCSLQPNTSQIVTKGTDGVETIKYEVKFLFGKEVSRRQLSDKITTKPVMQITNAGDTVYSASHPRAGQGPAVGLYDDPCTAQDALLCAYIHPDSGVKGQVTPAMYNTYVQQMKQHNCGTPIQYCLLNTSVPCENGSSGATTSSGFDAGYNYAEQYQICDPYYSNGNSQDFNDGVNAWTAANCKDGQLNSGPGN